MPKLATDSPDTAHSMIVTDHPFQPKYVDEPWSLCKVCNLAQSTHVETLVPYTSDAPPAPPQEPPPGARRVDEDDSGDDAPIPGTFPVPDITNEQYKEYALEPEDESCWKCGTKHGTRKIVENGAWLCAPCETIMRP